MALLETSSQPPTASRTRTLIVCLVLVAATLALYQAVDHNAFVNYDDDVYITSNPRVQAGLQWKTVGWAFTTFDAANWHPLTWLSHALDCQVFKLNPVGHHFSNVLLHGANVALLFGLLAEATESLWTPWLVALLFAFHPLDVESVP